MTTFELAAIALPVDVSPAQLDRVRALLATVDLVEAPQHVVELDRHVNTCVICHEGGKLGGHQDADGRVEWIHKSCHRRLHQRGRHRTSRAPRRTAS